MSLRSRTSKPNPRKCERRFAFSHPFWIVLLGLLLPIFLASCKPSGANPEAVVRTAYDRLNEGDVDGYVAFLSDDAVFNDGSMRLEGAQAIRADLERTVGQGRYRFEISNLSSEGNIVRFSVNIYEGDKWAAADLGAAVVVDGRIIFDGSAAGLTAECDEDSSQSFCPGG